MIERLREYDADVLECTAGNIADAISAQIKKCERRLLVAPHGLPQEWLVSGTEWRIDDGLTKEQIEECDGAVTAAECGIADSGTIVLHHSPAEGRRLLSLLPDWHLCILRASQVVETLPQYFERYGPPPALATFISGPSATADIEMTRIKGVHGPRFLNVLMVRDE
jgi:L-lactate dehydrogenase complex protein LldG